MNKTLERIVIGTSALVLGAGITFTTLLLNPEYLPTNKNQIQAIYFSPKDNCSKHVRDLIDSAKKDIYLEIYTFTDKSIAESLISAKKRGISIKVLFDKSQSAIPSSLDEYISSKGIEIKYDKGAGIMHNKVLIIDRETVSTGSFNFTQSADKRNNENLLFIRDSKIAAKYLSEFESLWNHAKK